MVWVLGITNTVFSFINCYCCFVYFPGINMILLSKQIKISRDFNNLTQTELAASSNVSRATIQRIESDGDWNWRLHTIIELFKTLDLSVDNLIIHDGEIYYDESAPTTSFSFGYEEGYQDGQDSVRSYYKYRLEGETFQDYEDRMKLIQSGLNTAIAYNI